MATRKLKHPIFPYKLIFDRQIYSRREVQQWLQDHDFGEFPLSAIDVQKPYWRDLPPGQTGRGPRDAPTPGRTWVRPRRYWTVYLEPIDYKRECRDVRAKRTTKGVTLYFCVPKARRPKVEPLVPKGRIRLDELADILDLPGRAAGNLDEPYTVLAFRGGHVRQTLTRRDPASARRSALELAARGNTDRAEVLQGGRRVYEVSHGMALRQLGRGQLARRIRNHVGDARGTRTYVYEHHGRIVRVEARDEYQARMFASLHLQVPWDDPDLRQVGGFGAAG